MQLFTSEIVEENLIILNRQIEVENEIRRKKHLVTNYGVYFICLSRAIYLRSEFLFDHFTLAKTEIIYPKNVRAKVAMDFT